MTGAPEPPALCWLARWPEPAAPDRPAGAWAWVGQADDVPQAATAPPSAAERAEACRRPAHLRAAFHRRRLLLRRFAAALAGIPPATLSITAEAGGRPRLAPPWTGWHLSSSHRGDVLALALARWPVGIDVEPLGPAAEPPWAVLADGERRALRGLPRAARWEAFLRLWTGKEAYLKATGEGLARDPATVAIHPQGETLTIVVDGLPVTALGATRPMVMNGVPHRASCVILGPGAAIIKA